MIIVSILTNIFDFIVDKSVIKALKIFCFVSYDYLILFNYNERSLHRDIVAFAVRLTSDLFSVVLVLVSPFHDAPHHQT